MTTTHFIMFSTLVIVCLSQRSPYAGRNPIGYPIIEVPTTSTTTASPQNILGNRFGNNNTTTTTTTTERLPLEALGDRELVNRLGLLPQDQQPFWLINWRQLEQHRKGPQTFAQKPNVFNNPLLPPPENAQFNRV